MLVDKIRQLLNLLEQKTALEKNKSELDKTNVSLQNEKQILLDKLDLAHKNQMSLKKDIAQHELDIKVFVEHEKHLKEKIVTIIKPKELDAVKREILSTQDKREQVETQLLETLDKSEKLNSKINSETPIIKSKIEEVDKQLEITSKYLEQNTESLKPILELIQSTSQSLPDQFKSLYSKIAHKLERPVVSIVNSSCEACYNFLSSQQLSTLKINKIGSCKNCNRILFWDKDI